MSKKSKAKVSEDTKSKKAKSEDNAKVEIASKELKKNFVEPKKHKLYRG